MSVLMRHEEGSDKDGGEEVEGSTELQVVQRVGRAVVTGAGTWA